MFLSEIIKKVGISLNIHNYTLSINQQYSTYSGNLKPLGHKLEVSKALEQVLFVESDRSLDFTLFIECSISCFQDQAGSCKPRMEFRQTSSVPPSCNRTYIHAEVVLES